MATAIFIGALDIWSGAGDTDAELAGRVRAVALVCLIGAALALSLAFGRDFQRHRAQSAAERADAMQRAEHLSRDLALSRRELEQVNQRLELALAAARIVVFTQDRSLRYEWVSRGDFGLLPDDFAGHSDAEIVGAEAAMAMRAVKERALASGQVERCEIGVLDRGSPRRIEVYVRPLSSANAGSGVLGAMIDVTDRYLDRESNRWLMRELSHRSQNLLAIVQSMARHTARGAPDVQTLVTRLCERLAALSACHYLLVRASFRGVALAELVRSQLLSAQSLVGGRVTIEGPPLVVRPDAAQTFAMAVSELASNALAFGALSRPGGRVQVSWSADAEPAGDLRFEWREVLVDADAPGAAAPRPPGFGSVVIERMAARALSGKVRQERLADGWRCEIVAPLRLLTAIEEVSVSSPEREPAHARGVGSA